MQASASPLEKLVAGELLAGQLRVIEEALHPQPEQLVLVAQVVGGGGEADSAGAARAGGRT